MVDYFKPKPDSSNPPVDGVNLREELTEMFKQEMRGNYYLYRRARLDANNRPIKHPETKTNRSGEPARDRTIPTQSHEGYVFDDYLVFGYFNHSQSYSIYKRQRDPGEINTEMMTLYMEYDFLSKHTGNPLETPTRFDTLFDVEKDLQGKLISPLKTREQYGILSADHYRLELYGRIEYYRLRLISLSQGSHLV